MFRRLSNWLSRSLANQLLFTYLLVLTIALMAVSVWALVILKSESISDLRNALQVEAVNLGLEIDNDLALDSPEATARIQAATDRHAGKLNAWVTVVDSGGHVIAESGMRPSRSKESISDQPEINDALAGIAAIYTRSSHLTKTDWLFVAYPVRSMGETAGVIRVGVPLTEINQRLHQDLIVFLEIILATLVVTVLISRWLAKRVTRPIRDMSLTARQIAEEGDISEFVPVLRKDEIGELANSFNQMISRLREQERLRQEFIANASHELKTPTMAIGSVVEALQAGAANDPELRAQFLQSLEKLVDRQSNLLKDLLDITRLDASVRADWHEEVNLSSIIGDALEQVRVQAEKKEIVLGNVSKADGAVVSGNSIQLQRAIVNLLHNAVSYTPVGGSVTVETRSDNNEEVEVVVKDTGPGIDSGDLPHIFERFYRADKSRTRTAGGTGLGLAITKEILVRHKGTVDVESVVGEGSTFTVTLPLARH